MILFDWLSANIGTIAVGAAVVAVIALVIVLMVRDKKKGKKTCSSGCSCSGCAMAGQCHTNKNEK